jgi:hypothetical protein
MRRHSVPYIPPQLCSVPHHFRNRGHDCLGPRVSRITVTNRCLGKHQARCYGIHVTHLSAFALIKYRHMPAGGTTPPLQSYQVQILTKPCWEKGIGSTYGFTASPEVGPGATVSTLQTGYPRAQDLSRVPQRQTLHPVGKGSSVAAALDPPPGAGGLWRHYVPCGSQPLRRARVFPKRLTSGSS